MVDRAKMMADIELRDRQSLADTADLVGCFLGWSGQGLDIIKWISQMSSIL